MDAALSVVLCVISALIEVYSAVPPDVCFHQFKWEDCGGPPKAVIYYYKSGSRCEVGIWRGCLPNLNMFADEYECVQTCIFSLRAKPHDFHAFQDNVIGSGETTAAILEGGLQETTATGADVTDGTGDDVTHNEGEETAAAEEGATGPEGADPGAEPTTQGQ